MPTWKSKRNWLDTHNGALFGSFGQVAEYMGTERKKRYPSEYGSPRHTEILRVLEPNDLAFAVKYHQTYVVIYEPELIRIDSGGYHTVTTKRRINDCLPAGCSLYQKDYTWYLSQGDVQTEFYDGICVTWDGKIIFNIREG